MKPCCLVAAIVAVFAHASAAHSAEPANGQSSARPALGALDAKQRSQIQGIGQTLLAAKGSRVPTTEEKALLDALHGLATTVDQALTLNAPSIQIAASADKTGDTISTQGMQSKPTRQTKTRSLLDPLVTRLRQHRQNIETLPDSKDDVTQVKVVHAKALARQAGALERAVSDAMAIPDDAARFARLAEIKQRLRPKTLDEVLRDQAADPAPASQSAPASGPAPTLTTITRHRSGLDDLAAGKP